MLGGVAIAGLFMIGGFRGDHPEVVNGLQAAEAMIGKSSRREKLHLAAVKAWAAAPGRQRRRLPGVDSRRLAYRRVGAALRSGRLFLSLPSRSLSAISIAQFLPAWDRDNPLTSFVLGAYAFGLEEAGELQRAEDVGRAALAGNPRDAWASHALAHVMETANCQDEGIAFLKKTRPNWSLRRISWRATTDGIWQSI